MPARPAGWRGARPLLAAVAAAWITLGAVGGPPLPQLERGLYDLRMRLLPPGRPDDRIAIVAIDDRALAAYGRWPWPRAQLAELVERIVEPEGAWLVGLDVVLAEPERGGALQALDALAATGPLAADARVAEALAALRPRFDGDARLAEAVSRWPVVLGFHLSNEPGAPSIGELPPPLAPESALGGAAAALPRWSGLGGNLAALQAAARYGAGCLNAVVDADGGVRRLPLVVKYAGGVHPTLALALARAGLALDRPPGSVLLGATPADGPLQRIGLAAGPLRIDAPVDAQGLSLVPYAEPGATIARHSAADVLAGTLPTDALRGRIVLVGVDASGLGDQHPTPVDASMSGTAIHAQMLAGLLSGRVMAEPWPALVLATAAQALIAAVLAWRLPRRPPRTVIALTLGATAGWLALALGAWTQAGWVLPMATGLALPPLLLATLLVRSWRRAVAARRQLARLFGRYVPPELVAEMSRAPERYTMASRSAELTVLFADIAGFTALAERMPPAELGAMTNLVFSHLTDVVHRHRGTLDKYIGDALMVFWGAPVDDPDHARHAVQAALAMRDRLPAIAAALAEHGWPPIALNIGIDTGTVVVGDMGSRHRRAYTALGDAVNLAARLQALASRHGLGLLIGEATRAALDDRPCLPLGTLPLRGRGAPEPVWLPLPLPTGVDRRVDCWAADWWHLRDAVDGGRRDEALARLAALQAAPPLPVLEALCRWQDERLQRAQPRG